MQRIYEPRDLLEAQMLSGMLAAEGIDVFLAGSHLIGAMGELPATGLLALMAADEEAERARHLIAEYNGAEPLPGDEPESYPGELIC
ncbi:putative signal transducing protein [Stutzerimonas chloritidismutans]|uniref:putative signal transducing protein n=1 Tax=Stutzerimonas chloritidismutans TaxID=203192 RepID=UPI003F15B65A